MKICITLFALLAAVGCAPKSESTSKFTVTTAAPAGMSDVRREAWQVERMFQSARFREFALGGDPRFSATKIELRIDQSKMRVEIFVRDSSTDLASEAARAYAKSAVEVLEHKRSEFEISPMLKVAVAPVEVTRS